MHKSLRRFVHKSRSIVTEPKVLQLSNELWLHPKVGSRNCQCLCSSCKHCRQSRCLQSCDPIALYPVGSQGCCSNLQCRRVLRTICLAGVGSRRRSVENGTVWSCVVQVVVVKVVLHRHRMVSCRRSPR